MADPQTPKPMTEAEMKARKGRNMVLGAILVGLVCLIAGITVIRLSSNVAAG